MVQDRIGEIGRPTLWTVEEVVAGEGKLIGLAQREVRRHDFQIDVRLELAPVLARKAFPFSLPPPELAVDAGRAIPPQVAEGQRASRQPSRLVDRGDDPVGQGRALVPAIGAVAVGQPESVAGHGLGRPPQHPRAGGQHCHQKASRQPEECRPQQPIPARSGERTRSRQCPDEQGSRHEHQRQHEDDGGRHDQPTDGRHGAIALGPARRHSGHEDRVGGPRRPDRLEQRPQVGPEVGRDGGELDESRRRSIGLFPGAVRGRVLAVVLRGSGERSGDGARGRAPDLLQPVPRGQPTGCPRVHDAGGDPALHDQIAGEAGVVVATRVAQIPSAHREIALATISAGYHGVGHRPRPFLEKQNPNSRV